MDCVESSSRRRATASQHEQWIVQDQVFQIYDIFANIPHKAQTLMLELQRDKHMEYLTRGLKQLSSSFCVLDANRPWLCYWILHSIALLGESIDYELENNAIDFLNRCQDPNGGFGGGPGQLPHLATTYAAVNSLVTLGGPRALSSINRGKLYTFLRRMKDPSGPFRMHDAGEIDVRACYTAISVCANILNILDDELVRDVGNYILSCQTYEGGIAGEPGSEAHGGYTFCGLATMILINEVNRLDLSSLINWVVFRQGVECGFQGRTNKLVDGCYSFWQGGVFALLQRLRSIGGEHAAFSDAEAGHCATESSSEDEGTDGDSTDVDEPGHFKQGGHGVTVPLFHSSALQQYIILCSQEQEGGFRDKPGKARDYYHTCYCLSGLSVCQYSWSKDENSPPLPRAVLGPYSNLLEPIHPLYNVVSKQYDGAHEFFSSQSSSY
ncbi:protein farnesyltransferase beta subunit, putative [Ricinus communis]|uniref:Protein farnesyltransferase subunit beta n=1 Tax=Ricinus communis TaxID=3988 RepID=B9RUT5_RICCO|nr:protein farnesyltransferase beta subunit, putative [Ricinus communis]